MARYILSAPSLNTPVGLQFLRLAEQLRDDSHTVVLLSFREGGGSAKVPEIPKGDGGSLTIAPWPTDEPRRLVDAIFFARLLLRVRPQCVVAQMSSANWMLLIGWLGRVPLRVDWYHMLLSQQAIDGVPWIHKLRVLRRILVYRTATHVVGVSQAAVDELVDRFKLDPRRCAVIYNSLAPPSYVRESYAQPCTRILSAGRLVRSKGHDVLIEAFAGLDASVRGNCELVILGEGPEQQALEALVRSLGVGSCVKFVGQLDHAEAIAMVSTADLFVHPSLMDNNPLAIIEAMSMGLPVIATRAGGVPEMIEHDREGLLVAPGDASALSDAMKVLLTDAALRERLGRGARARYLRTSTIPHWVSNVKTFLDERMPV